MTIREYSDDKKIPLREVYRMVERGELKIVEVSTNYQRTRKIKHIVGTV